MKSFQQYLDEGNPLAKIKAHADSGRHIVALSAQRAEASTQENNARHKELKKKVRAQGYGFREVEGHWDGGKKKSLIVHAKKPGTDSGAELHKDMTDHAINYHQDAIMHHDGAVAKFHGTNDSGWLGKGKVETAGERGQLHYNRDANPNQTAMKTGKKKIPATFSAEEFVHLCEELVEEFPFIEPTPPSVPFDGRTAIKSFTFI
jgi:hypothetical protein